MGKETLLTAARRAVRDFRIDESHGGLQSVNTLQSVHTLDIQVTKMAALAKAADEPLDVAVADATGTVMVKRDPEGIYLMAYSIRTDAGVVLTADEARAIGLRLIAEAERLDAEG